MSRKLLCLLAATLATANVCAQSPIVRVGAGSYATVLPRGGHEPQANIFKTDDVRGPTPTNRWWSSLAWMPLSDRQFPHPLAVEATQRGLRVFYPGPHIHVGDKSIMAGMPGKGGEDLLIGHSARAEFPEARVHGFSDWFVRASFAVGSSRMTVSYGHGSPFVHATYEGGEPEIVFGRAIKIWSGTRRSAVLGVTVDGKPYGLFGPSGSTWIARDGKTLVCRTHGKPYFALALLPEPSEEALSLFTRYAHAHVTDTRVTWQYDPATSTVRTEFQYVTKAYEQGRPGTLFALYPHQWKHTRHALTGYQYRSIRGLMKLGAGASFVTETPYPGVLPSLPGQDACDKQKLNAYLDEEAAARVPDVKDTYWEGKWLGKLATLAQLSKQAGNAAAEKVFIDALRTRLEQWFTACTVHGDCPDFRAQQAKMCLSPSGPKGTGTFFVPRSEPVPELKQKGLFYYNSNWGTLIGYPASYGSDKELNDHHFHYGYYLRAAAEVALAQPAWADAKRWGGMVRLLARDIANPARDDPQFPFLRNFDPYAGHSWACGHARFGDGNNQESSSEAMNAWCALILWGEASGDRALRDLGIYLFSTELAAINAYWFDVLGENRPRDFPRTTVAILWGGKADYATWFSGKPEAIHGINWLPMHGGSLYLGLYPDYVRRNYEGMAAVKGSTQWDEWRDLIWMYRALEDPDDALRQFSAQAASFKPEPGNSTANTYHWIHTLRSLGQVDRTVTADYPLFAVFRKGSRRTHVVYNVGSQPRTVTFSDGTRVEARSNGFTMAPSP